MFDADMYRDRAVAIDDYLLSLDFVVVAVVDSGYNGFGLMPVHVRQVLLGALPHDHVVIVSPFARLETKAGQEVLAWGGWQSAHEDTCYGNALEIHVDGGMTPRIWNALLQLDGKGIDQAGTYERLLTRLDLRAAEHATNWLASGASVAVVGILGRGKGAHTVAIGGGRAVVGSALRLPVVARWRSGECFVITAGDSMLLAIPADAPDTLDIPFCPDRLHLTPPSYRTPYGVSLARLPEVLHSDGTRLHFERIHGVVEPPFERRW